MKKTVYVKYNSTSNKIKDLLSGIKLHSEPVYDDQYIKAKVKTFSEVFKTLFDGDKGLNILVWLVLVLIVF